MAVVFFVTEKGGFDVDKSASSPYSVSHFVKRDGRYIKVDPTQVEVSKISDSIIKYNERLVSAFILSEEDQTRSFTNVLEDSGGIRQIASKSGAIHNEAQPQQD